MPFPARYLPVTLAPLLMNVSSEFTATQLESLLGIFLCVRVSSPAVWPWRSSPGEPWPSGRKTSLWGPTEGFLTTYLHRPSRFRGGMQHKPGPSKTPRLLPPAQSLGQCAQELSLVSLSFAVIFMQVARLQPYMTRFFVNLSNNKEERRW